MRVITTPSLLQVTVVAGPPVEVQVRVLDRLSYLRLLTLGEPENDDKLMVLTPTNDDIHTCRDTLECNFICNSVYWLKAKRIIRNCLVMTD